MDFSFVEDVLSQAYYWSEDLHGNRTGQLCAPANNLPDGTLVEVVTRDKNHQCNVVVHCDTIKYRVSPLPIEGATCEPFTQSVYYRVFHENLTCANMFSVKGSCSSPWAQTRFP